MPARKHQTCSEAGCDRPHYGHGLCNLHWSRSRGPVLRAPMSEAAKERMYDRRRLQLTGWSRERVTAVLEAQGGLCAICGEAFDGTRGGKMVADHDHVTGEPRGLLHSRCNLQLGGYEKQRSGIDAYLKKHA